MKRFTNTVAKIKNSSGEYEPIPALRGMTSYETAVEAGYTGSPEEWLALTIRALDDGWVTKYEELEANKANKSDVLDSDTTLLYFQNVLDKISNNNFKNLVVQKISSSCTWTAPKAANQLFRIFCVGAGGSGGRNHAERISNDRPQSSGGGGGGGGGGYITISDINIDAGTNIEIVCGAGAIDSDGGTTYFGELLSAAGGKKGKDGTATSAGNGGDGGSGGGGGGCGYRAANSFTPGNGGNGDKYGGGGGGGAHFNYGSETLYSYGTGGISTGCGNGGTYNTSPNDGIRFNGPWMNVLYKDIMDCQGIKGSGASGGSGGNGGNGGGGADNFFGGGGGGGGYCGHGSDSYCGAGGGGGGYYGNGGGHSDIPIESIYSRAIPGSGGGGFFCNGGDGGNENPGTCGGGGGGFFCNGETGKGGDGGVLIMYIKED